jgi:hypothetical protein
METTYKYVHLDRTNLGEGMEAGALLSAKMVAGGYYRAVISDCILSCSQGDPVNAALYIP